MCDLVTGHFTPLGSPFIRVDHGLHWTQALFLTHSDVDNTGKSYYGETNLYLVSLDGSFDGIVELGKSSVCSTFRFLLLMSRRRQGRSDIRFLLESNLSRVCCVLWLSV